MVKYFRIAEIDPKKSIRFIFVALMMLLIISLISVFKKVEDMDKSKETGVELKSMVENLKDLNSIKIGNINVK